MPIPIPPSLFQIGRRVFELDKAIRAQGIPIEGLGRNEDGTVRIDFLPEATAAQRTQALSIVSTWDWTLRRPRSYASLRTAIGSLFPLDHSALLNSVLADFLRQHPNFMQELGLSGAIAGDEPDVVAGTLDRDVMGEQRSGVAQQMESLLEEGKPAPGWWASLVVWLRRKLGL